MYVILFAGPVMTKFTIALREIGTYKEVLRSQVTYLKNFMQNLLIWLVVIGSLLCGPHLAKTQLSFWIQRGWKAPFSISQV